MTVTRRPPALVEFLVMEDLVTAMGAVRKEASVALAASSPLMVIVTGTTGAKEPSAKVRVVLWPGATVGSLTVTPPSGVYGSAFAAVATLNVAARAMAAPAMIFLNK
ncbi:hypothetical protein [Clavibacter sepedonicus]|uniref:hypothetical protein n=1 Tax=Clavibacter sepedonicus TaxID=31964 RepID=UPI003DA51058